MTAAIKRDASPQTGKGHGHTELSNELLEAIYAYPWASALAMRIVLWVVRDSYGWKRKVTRPLAFGQVATLLDAERTAVFKALRYLKKEGVLIDAAEGGWGLVKNYNAWGNTPELPGLSTPVDKSLPTGNSCPQATNPSCLQATETVPAGNNLLPTGNAYRRKKGKERKERGAEAPTPTLPNGKTDTPKARAELGDPDLPPHDHGDFHRLAFGIQQHLATEWEGAKAEAAKKAKCKKCLTRERAKDDWPYCKGCTECQECYVKATEPEAKGLQWKATPAGVYCVPCHGKITTATRGNDRA